MSTTHTKMADLLYDQFLEQITVGAWRVGTRIPTEEALTQRFSASRPVIREALGRLKGDGLLTARQGSGTYVTRSPDIDFLNFASVGSIAALLRCFEFRVGLEGEAAALAAVRRTDADLAAIKERLEQTWECVESVEVTVAADFEFHSAIIQASNNDFYVSTYESLKSQVLYGIELARSLNTSKKLPRAPPSGKSTR